MEIKKNETDIYYTHIHHYENYSNLSLPNTQFGNDSRASNILYNLSNATKSITLNTGFKVDNNAVFKIKTISCSYWKCY